MNCMCPSSHPTSTCMILHNENLCILLLCMQMYAQRTVGGAFSSMQRSLTRIHYGFMIPSDHMPCSSNTEYLWNISVAHHADPSWPYVLAGTRRSEPHGIRLWSPAAHCSPQLPYAHAVKPKRSQGKGSKTLIPYSDILLHTCIFLLFQQLDRVHRSVNNELSTYWIDPAAAGPREDDARTLCV